MIFFVFFYILEYHNLNIFVLKIQEALTDDVMVTCARVDFKLL